MIAMSIAPEENVIRQIVTPVDLIKFERLTVDQENCMDG